MKFSLLLVLSLAFTLNACNTIANRRDLYSPDKAHGPYTSMLLHAQIKETEGKFPHGS